ncbi:NADH:ubiquinone oxidoreductase [Cladochytrium tenue]|nr:NADH:ubiquinone oxidoreductase [Cladochytrium tenue]
MATTALLLRHSRAHAHACTRPGASASAPLHLRPLCAVAVGTIPTATRLRKADVTATVTTAPRVPVAADRTALAGLGVPGSFRPSSSSSAAGGGAGTDSNGGRTGGSSSSDSTFRRSLRGLRTTGRVVGALAVIGLAYFGVEVYLSRYPPTQFEWDHSKKTIAILGTGWGSTSLIKDLDTDNYNVVVVSPRSYFLFTPLLPSCTVGTIELRSLMQPIRYLTRFKSREVLFVEGNCTDIDPVGKTITVEGPVSVQKLKYDYLVVGVGAENATFGIKGVREHACFLKEAWDARKIRTQVADCLESAAFPGQTEAEVERLLHMVVVGGGPTGIEYAAELHDFLSDDIVRWYPQIAGKFKITLIEALPHVLPAFSKELIEYTEKQFAENKVTILNNTMVKEVRQKEVLVFNKNKELESIPYGLLVWATGNTARPLVADLMKKLPADIQNLRRGLVTDDWLVVKGVPDRSIYAVGDASATKWAPTAQVASRQGTFLADHFARLHALRPEQDRMAADGVPPEAVLDKLPQFSYKHLGSLAYIGSEKAIADLPGNVDRVHH